MSANPESNEATPQASTPPPAPTIAEPRSDEEWSAYYHLRWRVLRQPWGQPLGSEKDALEQEAIHLLACDPIGQAVGVGRLHLNHPGEAQIRFMAVAEPARGLGLGSALLRELEHRARDRGAKVIVLEARDTARPFYARHGYAVVGKGKTLFGTVTHHRMQKMI
jgi:ribosomal protein S18 acetylase RimI-like enzyme